VGPLSSCWKPLHFAIYHALDCISSIRMIYHIISNIYDMIWSTWHAPRESSFIDISNSHLKHLLIGDLIKDACHIYLCIYIYIYVCVCVCVFNDIWRNLCSHVSSIWTSSTNQNLICNSWKFNYSINRKLVILQELIYQIQKAHKMKKCTKVKHSNATINFQIDNVFH